VRYAVRSDIGLARADNEDAAYAGDRLLAVADGLGGHAAGEVASAAVISALRPLDTQVPSGELLNALGHAVQRAEGTLREMVAANPSLRGMGTTVTALLRSGSRIGLAHIGDTRAYLVRGGEVFQITRDHTVVQSLLDSGSITPDEASSHPQRFLLLQALDGEHDYSPDLQFHDAVAGDRYLLSSDGLHACVSAEAIGAASRSPGRFSRSSSPNAISAPKASAACTSWTPVTAVWVTDQISSRPANATSSHPPESGACACALRGSYRPAAATSQTLDGRQRFLGGRALRRRPAQSLDGGDEGVDEGRVELLA